MEKDADAVLDEVEAAIYMAAATILRGEGFSYDVPLRTKASEPGVALLHCKQTLIHDKAVWLNKHALAFLYSGTQCSAAK